MNKDVVPQSPNMNEFKRLISEITTQLYPKFFDLCESLISLIEQKVESPQAEEILTKIEGFYPEIQQFFFKEKLIIFPFLEKNYIASQPIEPPASIGQLSVQSQSIEKKIIYFKNETETVDFGCLDSNQLIEIKNRINQLLEDWEKLSSHREKIYKSFLSKKGK